MKYMPRLRPLKPATRQQWRLQISPSFLSMLGSRSSAPENARRRRVTTMKDVLWYISRPHEPPADELDEYAEDPVDVLVRILAPLYGIDPAAMAAVARSNEETSDGNPTYDVLLQYYMAGGAMKTFVCVSRNFLMANIEANLRGSRSVTQEGLIKIGAVLTGIESEADALRVAGALDRRRVTFARKVAMMRDFCRSLSGQNPGVRIFATINPGDPSRRKK